MKDIANSYKGETILITGGAGCVGSNLARKLTEYDPEKIIILDDLSSSYKWNIPQDDRIEFIQGDICDDQVLKWVFKSKPSYIFHLAAHFANQNSVDKPEKDLKVNGLGILKVLEYAQLSGNIKRFVYSSSGCGVYGLDSKMPFKEDDISISLHTPYQVTKLLGELYTNYFYNVYDLPIANARFFNVFGPGEVPGKYRNVIPNFMYWAMNEQPLPITGDGSETRDWTYIDDCVEGIIIASEKGINGKVYCISNELRPFKEILKDVHDALETNVKFNFGKFKEDSYVDFSKIDFHSLEKDTGYKLHSDFKADVKKTYDWLKNQRK